MRIRTLLSVLVVAASCVPAAAQPPACFKRDRAVEGLARLYAATQICPQFRPMTRAEMVAMMALGDMIGDVADVEACRSILDMLLVVSEGVVRQPGVCAEAAAIAARPGSPGRRWLRR